MRTAARIRQRIQSNLLQRAEKRLPSLTRLRGLQALPVTLNRQRIYILPTGFGLVFAVILLVMLLGALNYNNNAALLLTCVLGATSLGSMLQTFRQLDGLTLQAVHPGEAVAGELLPLVLTWQAGRHAHTAIVIDIDGKEHSFSVTRDDSAELAIHIPTRRRGWMDLPRLRVASRWPYGLFRAWSWLAPDRQVLVYPHPERDGPAPPPAPGDGGQRRRHDGDEWAGLRAWRPGDSLRLVAWKASARGNGLRVKTFDQPQQDKTWQLAWQRTGMAGREARIARLARWVNMAHAANAAWSLELPDEAIPAGRGDNHYRRCMQALAELP